MAKTRKKTAPIHFDELQLYFNKPYVIDIEGTRGQIVLRQPTIGEIMELGQEKFYSTLHIFTTNTTENRLSLWKKGMDWNKMQDYELFMGLYHGIDQEAANLLFENVQFQNEEGEMFFLSKKTTNNSEELTLYNESQDIEIDKEVYNHIAQYFRKIFNMCPKEEFTKSKMVKEWFIHSDTVELEKKKEKGEKPYSMLPLISACVNHPGFKYKISELKEITIYQFTDCVNRLQIYESSTALLKGMYSGFISGKDIKAEDYNFMKEIK